MHIHTAQISHTCLRTFVFVLNVVLNVCQDMAQLRADLQEVLQMQEEQEDALYRRERELGALKGALKEEVETHDKEMASLKEEYEQEVTKLLMAIDQANEVTMKGIQNLQIWIGLFCLSWYQSLIFFFLFGRAILCSAKRRPRRRRSEVQLKCRRRS